MVNSEIALQWLCARLMFNLEDLTEIDRVHIHLDSIRQLVFAYEVVVWMALQCVHPIMGLEF